MLKGDAGRRRVGHLTRGGEFLPIEVRVAEQGQDTIVLGRSAILPNATSPEEAVVDGDTVRGTLKTIAQIVEEQHPGYKCSILLVADGRFVSGAGPSLSDDYNAAIDGYAIGPTVGSCGTAIYWNIPIIAENLQTDPLWTVLADLARSAGVAACWSHPFTSRNGRVLGALALYSPEPGAPTTEQLRQLRAAARITGLAVERGRAEEALREKRKRELELEAQLRQAAKLEALGVLAGGVAHDFNNVLAAILLNTEMALAITPADTDVAEMLADIATASRRAGNFCKQMLDYAGHGTPSTSRVELGALFAQIGSLVQVALSKKATLEYSFHDAPIFVEGDENQLLQVIMNLVTNAAEALGEDEGCIVLGTGLAHYDADELRHLGLDADLPGGEYARVTVSDTGCGMDSETAARIFDPFFTTKFTGRGLGLAAVDGIVRGHRGVIQIESELKKGTTCTILLPTAGAPESVETASEIPVAPVSQRRVLVADDEEELRFILGKLLRSNGFDVVEAADGQEAIDIFGEDPASFDCVLLDFSMPRCSGDEVHRQLRALREDVPIVLMSGLAKRDVLKRFPGEDITGILQKPIGMADLLEAIHEAATEG